MLPEPLTIRAAQAEAHKLRAAGTAVPQLSDWGLWLEGREERVDLLFALLAGTESDLQAALAARLGEARQEGEPALSPEARREAVYALAGQYRDSLPSVDEFLAEKHAAAPSAFPPCPSCAAPTTHAETLPGGATLYRCAAGHQTAVPYGTPEGRLPAPAVWVAPVGELTPTDEMVLAAEAADQAEAERLAGLESDQAIQARYEGQP